MKKYRVTRDLLFYMFDEIDYCIPLEGESYSLSRAEIILDNEIRRALEKYPNGVLSPFTVQITSFPDSP